MRNIIYQPWGGLGDNLAHSCIPKLCFDNNIKCYLSKHNAFRNQQIHDFVWGYNPYVEVEKKDSIDLTWMEEGSKYNVKGLNHFEVIQQAYGFNPVSHYPYIYYNPIDDKRVTGKTIIDLTSHSISNDYNTANVLKVIKNLQIDDTTLVIKHTNLNYGKTYSFEDRYNQITINSLEEYSNIIASAARFITLHSGQSILASTIKNKCNNNLHIDVLTVTRYLPENNPGGYFFKNAQYYNCE